jgi:cytochrome c-type biogenesis protein CcmH
MTTFIIICAAMVAAALLWLIVPLLRARPVEGEVQAKTERRISAGLLSILVPLLAVAMYASLSEWDWEGTQEETVRSAQLDDLLTQLEARLASNPDDLNGWLLLARSNLSMQRFDKAIAGYERAYELSRGENVDAILGLAESLAMSDQNALAGRAGQLFEQALARAPNHPKALWYGSMSALQAGDLRKGRDRLQALLALGPPEELRSVLERQIQDLNQQLGDAQASPASGEGVAPAPRSIQVAVTLAPEIKAKLQAPIALFVLARDPAGGPPLAVQRHSSADLPLNVELSERDAMIAARSIATVQRVQVVARLSRSGTPQAQSGDFFGQADYEFGKDRGTLNIRIDQTVP